MLKLCVGCRYQIMVLDLLTQSTYKRQTIDLSKPLNESKECQFMEIHPPAVIDLSQATEYASQAALWGIEVSAYLFFFTFTCRIWQGTICKVLFFLGFARPRRNLPPWRFCRQAWVGRSWHGWMSSCCNASVLRKDFIGRSYKRSPGIPLLVILENLLFLGCLATSCWYCWLLHICDWTKNNGILLHLQG